MKEPNAFNRPRVEIALRKDVSITGEPLCPICRQANPAGTKFCGSCGANMAAPASSANPEAHLPPRVVVTKERHNRGRGSLMDGVLRIVILVALLAGATLVVLYVHDHYKAAEGRPETFTPTNAPAFSVACQRLAGEVLAPFDTTSAVQPTDIGALRQRARDAGTDPENATIARQVTEFADRMESAFAKRTEAREEFNRAAGAPAATLNPDPAEQQRVREFMQRSAKRRWEDFVAAQRDPVNQLLVAIEREERRLAAPRRIDYSTPWRRLTKWVGGWFTSEEAKPARAPAAASAAPAAKPADAQAVCPDCLGQGRRKCPDCGGFGSVPAREEKTCGQCAGSGQYQSKLSRSTIKCPFCTGTGKTSVESRAACAGCSNLGYAACARCAGTGRLARP